MFSTFGLLVSFMPLFSSKMEHSFLSVEERMTMLFAGPIALSPSLVVVLSFKWVLFSTESCLEGAFSVMQSSLQEKKKGLLDMSFK